MINQIIPVSNVERLRDAIALILGIELANQWTLDNTLPKIEKVWVNRTNPINSETESPTVTVAITGIDYDLQTASDSRATAEYAIDIFCASPSTDNYSGGSRATYQVTRVANLIRNILEYDGHANPMNRYGLGSGIVSESYINSLRFFNNTPQGQDVFSDIGGTMLFKAVVLENIIQSNEYTALSENLTQININGVASGMYYDFGRFYTTEDGKSITTESDTPIISDAL